MTSRRHKAREVTLQMLYQKDLNPDVTSDEIKEQKKEQEKQKFAWESTIMALCNDDLSKFNSILEMPVVLVFNILGMKKTLDI